MIITTLAIMIAIAGYLNYSGRLFGEEPEGTQANADLAQVELLDISDEDLETGTEDILSLDYEETSTPGEAVLTNSSASATVAQAKIAREQVRAQNKETLQGIIDNANLGDSEKQDAIAQMLTMTELAEQEVAIETLMLSKGFTEAVVSLTEDAADIVVNSSELSDANRAQIEDIVTRKTNISPENIVITPIRTNIENQAEAEVTE
jgi:stage III sporulation protein AH